MKVINLPPTEEDALLANVEQMERQLPAMLRAQKAMAQLRWEIYSQHLAAGFTPDQAMEIVLQSILDGSA